MTAKEYLQQIKSVDVRINLNIERLEVMKSRAVYSGGIGTSKADNQSHSSKDKLSNEVCDIVMLDEKITEQIERLANAKEKVINQIMRLNNAAFIQILYKRYLEYKSWRQISTEMFFSKSYTMQMHKSALEMFEEVYADEFCYLTE